MFSYREILLICNMYRYITLQKNSFIPIQKILWRGLAPKGFGTRTKQLRNVLERAWEHEPKGFGTNDLQHRVSLYIHFTFHRVKLRDERFLYPDYIEFMFHIVKAITLERNYSYL